MVYQEICSNVTCEGSLELALRAGPSCCGRRSRRGECQLRTIWKTKTFLQCPALQVGWKQGPNFGVFLRSASALLIHFSKVQLKMEWRALENRNTKAKIALKHITSVDVLGHFPPVLNETAEDILMLDKRCLCTAAAAPPWRHFHTRRWKWLFASKWPHAFWAYLVERNRCCPHRRSNTLDYCFLTLSQLLKELVDLEDKEAYFPVWFIQTGCGIFVRWQRTP